MLFIIMPIAMCASCTDRAVDDDLENSNVDVPEQKALGSEQIQGFDRAAPHLKAACEETAAKLEICISSDFESEILVSINNNSDDEVTIQHSYRTFQATVSLFDYEGRRTSPKLWEGSPPPGPLQKIGEQGINVRFDGPQVEAGAFEEVARICYQTRFYNETWRYGSKLAEVCLERG